MRPTIVAVVLASCVLATVARDVEPPLVFKRKKQPHVAPATVDVSADGTVSVDPGRLPAPQPVHPPTTAKSSYTVVDVPVPPLSRRSSPAAAESVAASPLPRWVLLPLLALPFVYGVVVCWRARKAAASREVAARHLRLAKDLERNGEDFAGVVSVLLQDATLLKTLPAADVAVVHSLAALGDTVQLSAAVKELVASGRGDLPQLLQSVEAACKKHAGNQRLEGDHGQLRRLQADVSNRLAASLAAAYTPALMQTASGSLAAALAALEALGLPHDRQDVERARQFLASVDRVNSRLTEALAGSQLDLAAADPAELATVEANLAAAVREADELGVMMSDDAERVARRLQTVRAEIRMRESTANATALVVPAAGAGEAGLPTEAPTLTSSVSAMSPARPRAPETLSRTVSDVSAIVATVSSTFGTDNAKMGEVVAQVAMQHMSKLRIKELELNQERELFAASQQASQQAHQNSLALRREEMDAAAERDRKKLEQRVASLAAKAAMQKEMEAATAASAAADRQQRLAEAKRKLEQQKQRDADAARARRRAVAVQTFVHSLSMAVIAYLATCVMRLWPSITVVSLIAPGCSGKPSWFSASGWLPGAAQLASYGCTVSAVAMVGLWALALGVGSLVLARIPVVGTALSSFTVLASLAYLLQEQVALVLHGVVFLAIPLTCSAVMFVVAGSSALPSASATWHLDAEAVFVFVLWPGVTLATSALAAFLAIPV